MNDVDINIIDKSVNPLRSALKIVKSLGDLARQRIVGWMETNRQITQMAIARSVGVSQSWVSMYKAGDIDASIDQLDAIARVFNHTLQELLDLRPNPKEQELLDAYRALTPSRRQLAISAIQAMLPDPQSRRRSSDKQ